MEITGIILAGGKNLRFGANKALVKIGRKTVIERIVEQLKPIANRFIVVMSGEQFLLPALPPHQVVSDVLPGKGPLVGIYSGLSASQTELNVAVACDMPFLSTALLRHMVEIAPGFDAVIPRTGDGLIEPLHAVYAHTCLPVIKAHLDADHFNIRSFLGEVKVRYVEEEECRRYDPVLLSFFNLNCPEDLELALRMEQDLGFAGDMHGDAVRWE
ncbi:MAG: molybdenum cofactor guanylyltransferase [Dehalococcoidia bacterium]|nr:molybdenum cofactor guanylyltransferase [Dehalococcoidia bacterium]